METELYIGSDRADITEETVIPLTFVMADLRNPESRSGSYSKTIVLPGSKANNKILKHIFEINIDNIFNPNKKVRAEIYQGGIRTFGGYMQLLQINKIDYDTIEYEVALISEVKDLWSLMGDKYVRGNTNKDDDISFEDLNHAWTQSNVTASWNTSGTSGFVYPLIDYGFSTSGGTTFGVGNLFPAIFIKEYVNRIFTKYGFKYQSDFLNTDLFNRLLIPYANSTVPQVPQQTILEQTVRVSRSNNYYLSEAAPNLIQFNDDSTPPNTDISNLYNNTTFTFKSPSSNTFNMTAGIYLRLRRPGASTPPSTAYPVRIYFYNFTSGVKYGEQLYWIQPWSWTYVPGENVFLAQVEFRSISASPTLTINDNVGVRIECNEFAIADYIAPQLFIYSYLYVVRPNTNAGVGDMLSMTNCVPAKMKQKDLMNSLIKMFNLYVEVDKDEPTKYIIEPRDNYIDAGVTVDWSSKHDNSQQVEIIPMSDLDWKELLFTYKDDKDYLNNLYKSDANEVYGQQLLIMDNDFLKERKKIELIFAPTPLARTQSNAPVIPWIYDLQSNNTKKMIEAVPRVLYWKGVYPISFQLYTTLGSPTPYASYPFAAHMDDPFNPTLDINFGAPQKVYYSHDAPIVLTDNNLFNAYYGRMIGEVVSKNAKMVRAYFKLNPMDIYNFRFNQKVFWRDAYYYVNKIVDYNANGVESTQVELIYINNEFSLLQ